MLSKVHLGLVSKQTKLFYFSAGCNCHNHSAVCVYNETVAQMNKSLDIHGNYSGGGVCQNCQVIKTNTYMHFESILQFVGS